MPSHRVLLTFYWHLCASLFIASNCESLVAQVRPLLPVSSSDQSQSGISTNLLAPRRNDLQYQAPVVGSPRPTTLQPIHSLPSAPLPNATDASANRTNASGTSETLDRAPTVSETEDGQGVDQVWQASDRQMLMSPGHLNDVAFINPQIGVAVGNRGLIWRTSDGGRKWSIVKTEWTGELKSIVFADSMNGWIVGGHALPIRGLHEGVVLRTQDGGATWKRLTSTLLPMLNRVGYDQRNKMLWAVGEVDGQYPSGLFESTDFGQNWNDVTVTLDADSSALNQSNPAVAAIPPSVASSVSNVAIRVGEEWILSNRIGVFRCVRDRATPVAISHTTSANMGPNSVGVRFRDIRNLGNRLVGLGTDGLLYMSRNRGQLWEPLPSLPATAIASPLSALATVGESMWVAPRFGQSLYRFDAPTQSWQEQRLPVAACMNGLHFVDERMGWIVGTNGQVFRTPDGGQSWQFLHRSHNNLAVLVIAAQAEDIPAEILAHLAVNQGLQVGVLCGRSNVPRPVIEQAFWQNEIASVILDPTPFDPQVSNELAAHYVQQYLDTFLPRVILVCPPSARVAGSQTNEATANLQVQPALWFDVAQRQQLEPAIGVAMIATLAHREGETSISSHALATNVGQLLHDVAWPSHQLVTTWQGNANTSGTAIVSPQTWGIKRLATLHPSDMTWLHTQTAAKGSFAHTLVSRPVRARTSATNLDAINQMARKSTWIQQTGRIETTSSATRELWRTELERQLWIPDSLHPIWIADLASFCEATGDVRKASLARYQVLQNHLDTPSGLSVLLPTLTWLISDEAQWENRWEARQDRLQRFAELQELFAREEAEGELTPEERRTKTLQRFGIEPGMESQVSAEAIEKILLLDQAQREATRQGRINPDPEIVRQSAVPQTKMSSETRTKQFGNQQGQLEQHTTTVSWDAPLAPDNPSLGATPVAQTNSIVDASHEQRLEIADKLIRQSESMWPSLNGIPEWWRIKARVKQERRDVAQAEVAWNKLVEMAQQPLLNQSLYQSNLAVADIEEQRFVSIAMAEYGDKFRLESLGTQQTVHLTAQRQNGEVRLPVRVLPVQWTLDRPYLDGQLSESFWSTIAADAPVGIAQDEQFLYLGLRIPASQLREESVASYPQSREKPQLGRDQAALDKSVVLSIDTDADNSQSFEICFDARGQVSERQNGQLNWNPNLFVARQVEEDAVVIELAIDLEDLAPIRDGKLWLIRVDAPHTTSNSAASNNSPSNSEIEKGWVQLVNVFGP